MGGGRAGIVGQRELQVALRSLWSSRARSQRDWRAVVRNLRDEAVMGAGEPLLPGRPSITLSRRRR